MKTSRIGTGLIIGGLLLLASALFIVGYNITEEKQAKEHVEIVAEVLKEQVQEVETLSETQVPDYVISPLIEMPVTKADGEKYVGILEIPVLDLSLPIISEWSYAKLKLAPCRYQGSVYQNNMIIMAHNYPSHFGALMELRQGDEVQFTDMDGNVFRYTVTELVTLQGTDVDAMVTGDWDLTLFTCTASGKNRVTVRCHLSE